MLQAAMLAFSAGALGGLANSVAVWLSGVTGLTAALGVAIAPAVSAEWLYPRLVWGGLWGFLFLSPAPGGTWWLRGLVFSLAPSLVQLVIVFPLATEAGILGLGLGGLTPVLVLVFNAVWGLVAAGALKAVGQER